ncbi:hypothetical protein [Thiohalophilus sp.]|uniref:hypothetical protein n=1 Tax=Thiohalophilus sp. TaxID=3028392 RepID=UPI002ACE7A44|nr:hypothetical protein [Thiohalophilus sp.]MDZ7803252.1 hypothetical protein [Thiohalophilus sp.]
MDIAESGGTFASRNGFLGLKGRFGRVLAGRYDTPCPNRCAAPHWGMFRDTIGDLRAIHSVRTAMVYCEQ